METQFLIERDSTENIAALRNRLNLLMDNGRGLGVTAANHLLIYLENRVRIGFCLIYLKSTLDRDISFGDFIESHREDFGFSLRRAYSFMEVAKRFQRDQAEIDYLESIGMSTCFSEPISSVPLMDQIYDTDAKSFRQLMNVSDLAPPASQCITHNDAQCIATTGMLKLFRSIDNAVARFVRSGREHPIDHWSDADREIAKRKLQPLIELYEQLMHEQWRRS